MWTIVESWTDLYQYRIQPVTMADYHWVGQYDRISGFKISKLSKAVVEALYDNGQNQHHKL
tara:strand:+ start:244 stop:426 length:183 start_codon:yes stop_codon:yes gene_type:complete